VLWGQHQQGFYDDLDRVLEPTIIGRRLDVGGFVLADPFELILRRSSAAYLREAWLQLRTSLTRYTLAPHDLSRGLLLHPGETGVPGLNNAAPSSFIGWTSWELADFDHDARFLPLNTELRQGDPALASACAWRSLKWRIAPANVALALRLFEAISTSEVSRWSPEVVVQEDYGLRGAWHAIARALCDEDQHELERAVILAKQTYSPIGCRIVREGYASYLGQDGIETKMVLPF